MRHLKILSPLLSGLLAVSTATAHFDKGVDLNGGHYDSFGDYHCHQAGCQMAPSRYDISVRRNRLSAPNAREMELFYNEEDWPHWAITGGCQTMRTQILVATSEVPVTYTNPRQCEVREGQWTDPYTGDVFTRAARLEIDHIIPPMYANAANGFQWDDQTRLEFANDPLNLIPVSRKVQSKKRDRGIGTWRPPEEAFHCEYATAWRDVSRKYDLDLFQRDRGRMNSILDDCDIPESDIERRSDSDVKIRTNGIPLPI